MGSASGLSIDESGLGLALIPIGRPELNNFDKPLLESVLYVPLDDVERLPLLQAVQAENLTEVQSLVHPTHQHGIRVHFYSAAEAVASTAGLFEADKYGSTALHYAVRLGLTEHVRCLLEFATKARRTEVRDKAGKAAMHWAAQLNEADIVELLLRKDGASVDAEDRFGWTPLHYLCVSEAAKVNDEENVKKVLRMIGLMTKAKSVRGSTKKIWTVKDERRRTPLHLAAGNGVTSQIVQKLVDLEPKENRLRWVSEPDARGWSALHWAVFYGHTDTVRVLIEAMKDSPAHPNSIDTDTFDEWPTDHKVAAAFYYDWATELIMRKDLNGTDTTRAGVVRKNQLQFAYLQAFLKKEGIASVLEKVASIPREDAPEGPEEADQPTASADTEDTNVDYDSDADSISEARALHKLKLCRERLEKIVKKAQLVRIFLSPYNDDDPTRLSEILKPYASIYAGLIEEGLTYRFRKRSGGLGLQEVLGERKRAEVDGESLHALARLILYDHAIIVDDSASMGYAFGGAQRKSTLDVLESLKAFFEVLNDGEALGQKSIWFASSPGEEMKLTTGTKLRPLVNNHTYHGTSRVGTALWEAVLKPRLKTGEVNMARPLVVLILTDGDIDPVEADVLERSILLAVRKLRHLRLQAALSFQFISVRRWMREKDDGKQASNDRGIVRMLVQHPELARVVMDFDWGSGMYKFCVL